jgi:inosose dehydratase
VTSLADRVAAAPASWGICELPGWGHQLPVQRVLAEMRDIGRRVTELGPDGFVPGGPAEQAALLRSYGLTALGGFCPLILHDPTYSPDSEIKDLLDRFVALGAETMVIAAATGGTSYDERPQLDDAGWRTLLANLERAVAMAAERGVHACVHPHVGTMIETREEVERVVAGSDVPLCLDTGHLTLGGADPVQLAKDVPGRIAHVHLKDIDLDVLATVRSSERTYTEGVRAGLYTPLGEGGIDLRELVASLEACGYRGWYVPEQDRVLAADPGPEVTLAEARASVAFLQGLLG